MRPDEFGSGVQQIAIVELLCELLLDTNRDMQHAFVRSAHCGVMGMSQVLHSDGNTNCHSK